MRKRAVRAAGLTAALVVCLSGLAPHVARGATASCPEQPLLSEELNRTPSVFVATVQATFSRDESRGAVLQVEEIWRGPLLARLVRVTIEDAVGAPRLDLRDGNRYLVAAEPDRPPTSGAVTELLIRACSVTRLLTADLAGLRPSDARDLGGGAGGQASGDGGPNVPWWLWALSTLLFAGAAATAFVRSRGHLPGSVPLILGAGGLAVLGGAVLLSVSPQQPVEQAASSVDPSASPTAAASAATPPVAADAGLVVRLEIMTHVGPPQIVSLHADGRLITSAMEGSGVVLRQQRLSDDGLDRVREAIAATGLLGPDAPAQAEYLPEPLPGVELGNRGGVSETLTTGSDAGLARVTWTPIAASDAHLFADAPEIDRLEALAQQLLRLGSWLPPAAWADPEPRPYHADTFIIRAETMRFGTTQPAVELRDLAWPLDTPLGELTPAPGPIGQPVRCAQLSRSQAAALLASIAESWGVDDLTLASAGTFVAVDDTRASVSYALSLLPLLPDEPACVPAAGPIPTELAAGAIALVRVDALRVRSGPGPAFEAVDAFMAGEHVAVVADAVRVDGLDWYEVRQGPSGRGGYVTDGPADGDPWLVAVANGSIAFHHGDGRGEMSIGRVEPDGTGLVTLIDGGSVTWSPDGSRFAFGVPPHQSRHLAHRRGDAGWNPCDAARRGRGPALVAGWKQDRVHEG
jgi:hypothetical protein